jgi:hypothetical protein
MPTPQIDTLSHLALAAERQVNDYLTEAFNLNMLGVVEDKGATVEALMICSRLNAAIIVLSQFQNSVMNRCTGT